MHQQAQVAETGRRHPHRPTVKDGIQTDGEHADEGQDRRDRIAAHSISRQRSPCTRQDQKQTDGEHLRHDHKAREKQGIDSE